MKITVDGEAFEFDQSGFTNVEGMAVEKATGMLFAEWAEAIEKGSMTAQTGLVWLLKRRREPGLAFADVVYTSLSIEDDDPLESDPKDADVASATTD